MNAELEAATGVIEDFFVLLGKGSWDEAARHLAPEAHIVYPGGVMYESLRSVRASGESRYRFVDKVREHYDACSAPDGAVVVVSTGTLFGENLHGVAFANVRYVDRFVLRDGVIHEQHVWNDLANSGVLAATSLTEIPEQWRGGDRGSAPAGAEAVGAPAAYVRRSASANWRGGLRDGSGTTSFGSGAVADLGISLQARRSEESADTSAEELVAAAHASCFTMSLRGALDRARREAGHEIDAEESVDVTARCSLRIDESGWTIEELLLTVSATGIQRSDLATAVESAEESCTISRLVRGNARVTVVTSDGGA